jgi:acetyl-CoA synthetase
MVRRGPAERHAFKNPDKPAIIYEADDAADGRIISYGELLREVSRLAYTLKEMGVRKGDTVALYLPMIPEAVIAFLACSRIGAVHSVVFAGFSSDSLRDRILDAESKVVITTDEGKRGGKTISTKKIVDDALKQCPGVSHCLVYKRTGTDVPWTKGRDYWWHEEVEKYPNYIAPESMSSEDPLFLLYTSGSTGKPKGVMHTTGGYLIGAAATVCLRHPRQRCVLLRWRRGVDHRTHLCCVCAPVARCCYCCLRGHAGVSKLLALLGYCRQVQC